MDPCLIKIATINWANTPLRKHDTYLADKFVGANFACIIETTEPWDWLSPQQLHVVH